MTDLSLYTVHLGIVCATLLVALGVFAVAGLRRRALQIRPLHQQLRAPRAVWPVGISVVTLTLLVAVYLMLGV